jgi:outer membrane receptor protein involved in Fe transport
VGVILAGVGPAAADSHAQAPSSLRMRPRVERRWFAPHWPKRVAQAAPDQAAGDPPADGTTPAEPAPAPIVDPAATPAPDAAPASDATPARAPAPTVDQTPALTDEELARLAEEEAKTEVITVTGSTIERKTLTTPAPVTILNREDLQAAGRATVGDIIQALPAQSNAINAQTNNGGDGSTRVNIRGLGTARTLVLVNGRRVVPGGTGADDSVDLNAIPLAVLDRVEVLKDGASAVYGSDAVGGVVNLITRTDFNGTELNLFTGGSPRGDGFTYDASFVTGHTSEDKKANIVFSAGVQRQDEVFAGDRDFSQVQKTYAFASGVVSKSGSTAVPDGRIDTSQLDVDGDQMPDRVAIPGCTAQFCKSNRMGGFTDFDPATDLYNFQPVNYLFTPSERYNLWSSGTYKFVPTVNGFFEASYLNRTSDQELAPEPFAAPATVSRNSIYNPLGADVMDLRRRLEEFGPRHAKQNVDTFRVVAGFQGKVAEDAPVLKDWKWELSYNYGRTSAVQVNEGNLILSRLANALGPSFRDDNDVARCGAPGAVVDGCVPMNILGPAQDAQGRPSISQEMIDYVTFTGVNTGFNQQQTVLAEAHGRIVKLPNNGDIALAVGADYRDSSGGFTPDPLTATGDTTGNAVEPTSGSFNVAEAFGEISIVPVSGKGLAQWVELDLAARAFRYNTFGSGATWKASGLFRTLGGVAVRGTYSTAFRAPSIAELFTGSVDDFQSVEDPCDANPPSTGPRVLEPDVAARCRAQGVPEGKQFGTTQQRAVDGGNPNLDAETARVLTAGLVYEPPQVKGLSFTLDYWRVEIDKAIQVLGASAIFANCYTRGIDSYCAQIHRDPISSAIDFVENPVDNVGGATTSGLDIAVVEDAKLGSLGRVRAQIEAQYLFLADIDNSIQTLHGRGFFDNGVFPKYKANLSAMYTNPKGFGGGFNVRYVGSYRECQGNDCNTASNLEMLSRDVSAWVKTDLFLNYDVKSPAGLTRFAVGVNNLLDSQPPVIYTGPAANAANSDPGTYDYMGRFLYARLTQQF